MVHVFSTDIKNSGGILFVKKGLWRATFGLGSLLILNLFNGCMVSQPATKQVIAMDKPLASFSPSPLPELPSPPPPKMTPVPYTTPTPNPPYKKWHLKVFNINDHARIFVNGRLILYGFVGVDEIKNFNISEMLLPYPTANSIEFEVYNQDNDSFEVYNQDKTGASWGFEVTADDQIMYRDIRGKSSGTGAYPARRGDLSNGMVYRETFTFLPNGVAPGKGEILAHVYNTTHRTILKVGDTPILDTDSVGKDLSMASLSRYLLPEQFNLIQFQFFNYGGNYAWGVDITRGKLLLYRNRDGEAENIDKYPSGARFNDINCCSEVNTEAWNMFIAPRVEYEPR